MIEHIDKIKSRLPQLNSDLIDLDLVPPKSITMLKPIQDENQDYYYDLVKTSSFAHIDVQDDDDESVWFLQLDALKPSCAI